LDAIHEKVIAIAKEKLSTTAAPVSEITSGADLNKRKGRLFL
jgi:hypothetical protein